MGITGSQEVVPRSAAFDSDGGEIKFLPSEKRAK
jgi:hypothetical protein